MLLFECLACPSVVTGVVDPLRSNVTIALKTGMQRDMQLADSQARLACSRSVQVSNGRDASHSTSPDLIERHDIATQSACIPGDQSTVHLLKCRTSSIRSAITEIRRSSSPTSVVPRAIKVIREGLCLSRLLVVFDIRAPGEVGQLRAQLVR